MPWTIEYGQSLRDDKWYWRLINRDYDPYWIAAIGGGGWDTLDECWEEIQTAKREMFPAPPINLGYTFSA